MSLQSNLNQNALEKLPKILSLIRKSDVFNKNQMICRTLTELQNSATSLDEMTHAQRNMFQLRLINVFKQNGWMNEI